MVIHLGDVLPHPSCGLPEGENIRRNHLIAPSVWPCSRWGLPSHRVTPMLVSSYLTFPPLPFKRAVSVSMALSEDHSSRALPGIPSMESGLSSGFKDPATIRSTPGSFESTTVLTIFPLSIYMTLSA
ncbi:MAG: hypothetical protein PWQ20_1751 [Thermotogaceae bacterium]|nr:hypothetical protein [Thermotogaceae bacterium]